MNATCTVLCFSYVVHCSDHASRSSSRFSHGYRSMASARLASDSRVHQVGRQRQKGWLPTSQSSKRLILYIFAKLLKGDVMYADYTCELYFVLRSSATAPLSPTIFSQLFQHLMKKIDDF